MFHGKSFNFLKLPPGYDMNLTHRVTANYKWQLCFLYIEKSRDSGVPPKLQIFLSLPVLAGKRFPKFHFIVTCFIPLRKEKTARTFVVMSSEVIIHFPFFFNQTVAEPEIVTIVIKLLLISVRSFSHKDITIRDFHRNRNIFWGSGFPRINARRGSESKRNPLQPKSVSSLN